MAHEDNSFHDLFSDNDAWCTWCVIALVGHTSTQRMQTMWHGVSTAIVSNGEMNGSRCKHTAMQAPH